MADPTMPQINEFPAAKQRLMDELLAKNSAGTISTQELQRLEDLVSEAESLMVANSKLLADFARSQAPAAPSQAVPVTVWVNPDLAER